MNDEVLYYFVLGKGFARIATDEPNLGSMVLHKDGTPWTGESIDDVYETIPLVNKIINGRVLKEMGGFAFLEYKPSR